MPSDSRLQQALDRLARPIGEFRATVAGALAQAEGFLADQEPDSAAQVTRVMAELGDFATGRLDVARFVQLTEVRDPLSVAHRDRLQRAVDVLRDVLARGVSLHVVDVPTGAALVPAVDAALARAGRAFGAVLAIELLRSGRFVPEEHDPLLERLPFRAWTRAERRFAPPLVISVDGADLHTGGLADYLDGFQKLVLLVRGVSPPAALVRLITPGTTVAQLPDDTLLERIGTSAGPAIVAWVDAGAAHFLHDPTHGREPWQRLTIWHHPAAPKQSLGGMSAWQLQEDVRQLAALAAAPSSSAPGGTATSPEAVDVLARWLLGQSNLEGAA